ncbi:MAG: Flp pilus assembly protein CpaB [Planctomycetaceae bacterium]|jgi:Flp pilus assembly protein CpaB|nr:Flp pilus assembly protein CpaB [Planctomycetaceae bacterium]
MRFRSYFILCLAFATGVACSFFVAATFFWAKPESAVNKIDKRPRTEIIISKCEIPAGTLIDANLIRYQSVVIDEVPEKTLTNFNSVSGRKAVYNIPEGCPICEEMITDPLVSDSDSKLFVPPGYRAVPIRIAKVNGKSTSFVPGELTDIAVVPRQPSGSLAEKRNNVLGINSSSKREVLFENVTVFSTRALTTESADGRSSDTQLDEITVLLTQSQLDTLERQSQLGTLRLSPVVKEIATPKKYKDGVIAKKQVLESASVEPPLALPVALPSVDETTTKTEPVVSKSEPKPETVGIKSVPVFETLPQAPPLVPTVKPLTVEQSVVEPTIVEQRAKQVVEPTIIEQPPMPQVVKSSSVTKSKPIVVDNVSASETTLQPTQPSRNLSFVVPNLKVLPTTETSSPRASGVSNRPFSQESGKPAASFKAVSTTQVEPVAEKNIVPVPHFNPFDMSVKN